MNTPPDFNHPTNGLLSGTDSRNETSCLHMGLKTLRFCFLAAILAGLLWLLSLHATPGKSPLRRDAGVFLYGGDRLLHGEMPYVGFWDHKPPMVFLWNALGIALDGRNGVLLLETCLFGTSILVLFLAASKTYGAWPSFWGVLLLVCWSRSGCFYEGGNLTECFAVPFIILVISVWLTQPSNPLAWLGAGICSGLAFFTKQTGIAVPLAVFLGIGYQCLARRTRADSWRLIAFVLGGCVVAGAMILWLWRGSALGAFWDSNVVYSKYYVLLAGSHISLLGRVAGSLRHLGDSGTGALVALSCASWGMLLLGPLRKASTVAPRIHVVFLVALAFEVAFEQMPYRFLGHYGLPLLPLAAMALPAWLWIAGFISRSLFVACPKSISRRVAAVVIALVPLLTMPGSLSISGFLWTVKNGVIPGDYGDRAVRLRSQAAVVGELRHVAAEKHLDKLYVWGAETWVNFAAELPCPSRYTYAYPVLMPEYGSDKLRQLIQDLRASQATLLVDSIPGSANALDYKVTRSDPEEEHNPYITLAHRDIEEIREFVARGYRRDRTLANGWIVYVPTGGR